MIEQSGAGKDLLHTVLHLSAREPVQEWVTAARANLSRLNTETGDGAEDPSIADHREQLLWWVDLLDQDPGQYKEVLRDLRDRRALLIQEKKEIDASTKLLRSLTRQRIHIHLEYGGEDGRQAAIFERTILNSKLSGIAAEKSELETKIGRIRQAIIVLRRLAR